VSDDALRALERTVRAGDASARPALVRALLRAGRPVHEAWGAAALRAGPGLRGGDRALTAEGRDRFADDLASLAPDRLVDHLNASKGARRLLEIYPAAGGARWLTVTGRGQPADPWRVDLSSPPASIGPGQDARLQRHRWDDRCVSVRATLPLGVPVPRLAGLGVALFARLGAPLTARVFHRRSGGDDHAEHETETLHVDGDRCIRVHERWGPPPVMESRDRDCDAAFQGLPGAAPVTLTFASTLSWIFQEAWWVGRPHDLAAADAAWRDVLFAAARARVQLDDDQALDRLLPDAWRARARRAVVLPADGHVVVGPAWPASVWSIAPVDGVPFALAVTGGLAVDSADPRGGPSVRPVGPAPVDAVAHGLRAKRPARDAGDALGALFRALTGEDLPARPEVERRTALAPGDRPRGSVVEATRLRLGPWVALRTRDDRYGARFRVLHDAGAVALLGTSQRDRAFDRLELVLLAAPGEAEALLDALRAALEREGFEPER
jgi:hypothetical protein